MINRTKKLYLIIRRLILLSTDLGIIYISIFITSFISEINNFNLFIFRVIFPIISVLFLLYSGHYKGITKYIGSKSFYSLCIKNFILTIIFSLILKIFNGLFLPIRPFIIYWLSSSLMMIAYRVFLRDLIKFLDISSSKSSKKVLIYGAGDSGAQLAASIKLSENYELLGFMDDSNILWGRNINGIPIYSPSKIKELSKDISQVFLAIPSLDIKKKKDIINSLNEYSIKILQIPFVDNLKDKKITVEKLEPINYEDLLGRDKVNPDENLIRKNLESQSILITGAGGSIGSELCRQIIKFNPAFLILFENSELALYKISNELNKFKFKDIKIISILGDCQDKSYLEFCFSKYNPDIIFHAAAYKHVPLVQSNPLQGIKNNVFSTLNICRVSFENNVKRVVLISSDKAVRPTNVMGASKRLSELIIQAYAKKVTENSKSKNELITKFSMVRFGNVLGSSGSVVPLFMEQINNGGPITLTHEKVVRFFMTISEASQLVLQAAELSSGGDLFLLDMGEPVKIKDLALNIINLRGLTVKDKKNPEGDIEIKVTGLRPGEKLYEELLIDPKKAIRTSHPLIYKADEEYIEPEKLFLKLDTLEKNINLHDKDKVFEVMSDMIPNWKNN